MMYVKAIAFKLLSQELDAEFTKDLGAKVDVVDLDVENSEKRACQKEGAQDDVFSPKETIHVSIGSGIMRSTVVVPKSVDEEEEVNPSTESESQIDSLQTQVDISDELKEQSSLTAEKENVDEKAEKKISDKKKNEQKEKDNKVGTISKERARSRSAERKRRSTERRSPRDKRDFSNRSRRDDRNSRYTSRRSPIRGRSPPRSSYRSAGVGRRGSRSGAWYGEDNRRSYFGDRKHVQGGNRFDENRFRGGQRGRYPDVDRRYSESSRKEHKDVEKERPRKTDGSRETSKADDSHHKEKSKNERSKKELKSDKEIYSPAEREKMEAELKKIDLILEIQKTKKKTKDKCKAPILVESATINVAIHSSGNSPHEIDDAESMELSTDEINITEPVCMYKTAEEEMQDGKTDLVADVDNKDVCGRDKPDVISLEENDDVVSSETGTSDSVSNEIVQSTGDGEPHVSAATEISEGLTGENESVIEKDEPGVLPMETGGQLDVPEKAEECEIAEIDDISKDISTSPKGDSSSGENSNSEEDSKKKHKKKNKKKHKKKIEVNSSSEESADENGSDENGSDENGSDADENEADADENEADVDITKVANNEGEDDVKQSSSENSSDEETSKKVTSGDDTSEDSDDSAEDDSSEESDSTDSEPVKKRKKKKVKKKKKKRKHESDSSSDDDSDDSERSSKKKRRKRKKKKKRRAKYSRKKKKSKVEGQAVVMDKKDWTAWLEKQKEKMRAEIIQELQQNIAVPSKMNNDPAKKKQVIEESLDGQDAEIADCCDEIKMGTQHGFSTGIPLRKDEEDFAELTDKDSKGEEEIFSLFKSDDDLDFDESEDDENWKRRNSKEKEVGKKTGEESRKREKEKEVGKKTGEESRKREKEKHKHQRDMNEKVSRKERPRNPSPRKDEKSKHAFSKRKELNDERNKPLNRSGTRERNVKKHDRSRSDGSSHESPMLKVESDKHSSFTHSDTSKHEKGVAPRISDRYHASEAGLPLSTELSRPHKSGDIKRNDEPKDSVTPVDGIAIANKVRDKVYKLDDFWKGDGKGSRKRPLSSGENIFKDSITREKTESATNDPAMVGRRAPDQIVSSKPTGHWEAPFADVQMHTDVQHRLIQMADSTYLGRSIEAEDTVGVEQKNSTQDNTRYENKKDSSRNKDEKKTGNDERRYNEEKR